LHDHPMRSLPGLVLQGKVQHSCKANGTARERHDKCCTSRAEARPMAYSFYPVRSSQTPARFACAAVVVLAGAAPLVFQMACVGNTSSISDGGPDVVADHARGFND